MKLFPRVPLPIGVKLVALTVLLIVVTAFVIGKQCADQLVFYGQSFHEEKNKEQAEIRAKNLENLLDSLRNRMKIIATVMLKFHAKGNVLAEEDTATLKTIFDGDPDFAAIDLWESANGRPSLVMRRVNTEFFSAIDMAPDYVEKSVRIQPVFLKMVENVFRTGGVEIRNSTIAHGVPLITIAIPLVKGDATNPERITYLAVADVRLERIQKMAGEFGSTSVYIIDSDGMVLAHPDDRKVAAATQMTDEDDEIVGLILSKHELGSLQQKVIAQGEVQYGAFRRTNYGPIVVAETPEKTVTEPGRILRQKVNILMGYVLAVAFFLMVIFSISLTQPLEKLVALTKKVARGDFEVRSNIRTGDEVEELSRSFNGMIRGLKERDKIKSVMVKFHGSSVTDTILKGDIALGGSQREVSVLFSDLRNFTKFSEGREPAKVVEMLNEYFSVMVSIINLHHGVVDKFIGDAIMAIWGAPQSSGDDPGNAVLAALHMRQELAVLNQRRLDRGDEPILIGVGVHSGLAIAGQIGSEERMEYTVIGDTVNQSSRIESATKSFGTDLLISMETASLVQDRFMVEFAGEAEVKGKAEPLKLFKVQGYVDTDGQQIIIKTPYSEYEGGASDKIKVSA